MTPRRPLRIANCSGFYGDRISAPADLLAGPEAFDVLTGDYLAELTMLILWKARRKDPRAGYATTFLRQMEQSLGTILDRGIKVVANAGGLNPTGLADELAALADRLGLSARIAVVEGDDIVADLAALQAAGETFRHLDTGQPLADLGVTPTTANAYLGGFGVAAALEAGADLVVCPRITDAALVVGPAVWWHGWTPTDLDRLAGAVVAGHVIECGAQCTGGNYSLDHELPDLRYPGFPIAEMADDGSCVITKQPGTGGAVTVGTVTAQLLYEIGGARYPNPDVVARFDTIEVNADGPDRVRISGTVGEPAPDHLKVAMNYVGGYRNSMTFVLTGLDIERKAERATAMLWDLLGGPGSVAESDVRLISMPRPDSDSNELATAQLRVTVKDPDPTRVGRRFSNAVTELALASYAGFFTTSPPTPESEYGVYWPTLVPATAVHHRVRLPDGQVVSIPHPAAVLHLTAARSVDQPTATPPVEIPAIPDGPTVRVPLGAVCGARSGDKGGNANVGLWTWDDAVFAWMASTLTVERFRALVPEAAALDVERHVFPNLRALNFVAIGLLGAGVASSTRPDAQAKGLGEYLRSRLIDLPENLVPVALADVVGATPPHTSG